MSLKNSPVACQKGLMKMSVTALVAILGIARATPQADVRLGGFAAHFH